MGRARAGGGAALTITTAESRLVQGLMHDLGLTAAELAMAVSVHPRTVERWLNGDTPQRNEGRGRLYQLAALRDRLCILFGSSERVSAWLRADNRYLGGLAPADALRAGRIDRVDAAAGALASGTFV